MAYGASVGSKAAQRRLNAVGFIGNATDATAHFFGREKGLGTVPHALIGYAGSTLRAAQMFHECFPKESIPILADYFGLSLSFAPMDKETYLAIVDKLFKGKTIDRSALHEEALRFAADRGGYSGRTARHFLTHYQIYM